MIPAGPADHPPHAPAGPVLLFDGGCPLCHAVVRGVLRNERRPDLRFAPLDGPTARALLAGRPDLQAADSVVWVERDPDGAVRRAAARSDAVLQVLRHLRAPWSWLGVLRVVPRPLRDAVYDAVARRRRRSGVCPPLPPGHAHRFEDT